jgi:glycosyltransferase involved in cell wall biosynthesis
MRLGVNVVRLTRQFTGVGRFIECILKEWSEMELPFDQVTLFSPSPLLQERVVFPIGRFNQVVGGPRAPDPFWEARFLSAHAGDVDVLFCPSYTIPIGYPGRCAVTNLGPADERPLTYTWLRSLAYEQLYRYSAHRAAKVFACSNAVKRRLVESYGIAATKITVAYLAPGDRFKPIRDEAVLAATRSHYGVRDRPFALFVGKLAGRHSIPNLIKAFARVRQRFARHALVICGPNSSGIDVAAIAREARVDDAVIYHPFVEHRDLPALYSAAEELIFPATDAEGFGLPVIEAMACGTPVVTVNRGSLPEFATGAAMLVESSSVDDLARGLASVIGDPRLRLELSQKGVERAKQITWRISAERIMEQLRLIAEPADPSHSS